MTAVANIKSRIIYKKDLVYPELSYQIVGILFDVFKQIGFGHRELYYQNAIETGFKNAGLAFKRESRNALSYRGNKIGVLIPDFIVDNKVVLEIKQGNFLRREDINQTYEYLRTMKLKLGILARYTKYGVRHKRIINLT